MRALPAALLAVLASCAPEAPPADDRAPLAVMAGVPLLRGAGDIGAQLDGAASPMRLKAMLERDWRLMPLDDATAIPRDATLLMIQPRALRPAELAALDRWVRRGGRALIIVDPALVWPDERPLGAPDRPPFATMLSPLFARWGLELVLPMPADAGAQEDRIRIASHDFPTAMPGRFDRLDGQAAACRIGDAGLLARCALGKGEALLVADADFLDERRWPQGLTGRDEAAGAWVVDTLASMHSPARRADMDGRPPGEAREKADQ